jgi:hypothetical protein
MKRFLTASVAINILLAGFVLWLVRAGRPAEKTSSAPARTLDTRAKSKTPPAKPPSAVSAAVSFHWSQLESTNYRTYIANLRGIECPEQTVRDIIAADVDEAFFAPRRGELKPDQTAPALEYALRQLNQEEAALVATLLGDQPTASAVAVHPIRARILRVKSQAEREADRPVSLPLVLQPVNPDALKLTETQIQTINDLRQTFLEEIGGTNQDPSDPAYRRRWQAAQREADDMLTGMFGRNFTLNYRMQSENLAAQPK